MRRLLAAIFILESILFSAIDSAAWAATVRQRTQVAQPTVIARSAVGPAKVSVQGGTSIKPAAVTSMTSNQCRDTWFSCLDGFCLAENENGGRCLCSDSFSGLSKEWNDIEGADRAVAARAMGAVAQIESGAKAEYVETQTSRASARSRTLNSLWGETETATSKELADMSGGMRYSGAMELCRKSLPASCETEMDILQPLYSKNVRDDCAAFENAIKKRRDMSAQNQAASRGSVRAAAIQSIESTNKFNRGQCLIEYKKCMQDGEVCGEDWSECINGRIDTKKLICEKVLDNCTLVRDEIFPLFMRESGPAIAKAQLHQNSDIAGSCLADVSNCIVNACRDDIEAKGVDTMDSCLSRPEMARSFCKVELDRCEPMAPGLWDYAKIKLGAMRVDRCTEEVKECFADEGRCGEDWLKCIGLDYAAMHKMCPVDKLVVCKANNPNFDISDLDNMVMGIYLGLDNSALEECTKIAQDAMIQTCGSLDNCDGFDIVSGFGGNSLRQEQNGLEIKISGLVSWPLLKISDGASYAECVAGGNKNCDTYIPAGILDIDDYMSEYDKVNSGNSSARARVLEELEGLQAQMDAAYIRMESQPLLSQCLTGRDLSQITGKNERTSARFPNITRPYRLMIAHDLQRRAAENYSKKLEEMRSEIVKSGDLKNAQYACACEPMKVESTLAQAGVASNLSGLSPAQQSALRSTSFEQPFASELTVQRSVSDEEITALAGQHVTNEHGPQYLNIQYDMWSAFTPETRNCKVCSVVSICGEKEIVKANKEKLKELKKNIMAYTVGGAIVGGGIAVGAAALAAGITTTLAIGATTATVVGATAGTAALTATGITTVAGTVGTISATTAAATTTTAFSGAMAAAGASSAVPVVGWVVAAVIVVAAAFVAFGINNENWEHVCESDGQECSDIQM